MRRPNRTVLLALCLCASLLSLSGCIKEKNPDFSNARKVAELATLECYYHNVATYERSSDFIFGLGNIGYKKLWFEYSGIVQMGIDASKVTISPPNGSNEVTITVPPAQVLGLPNIDEGSISDPIIDTGLFTGITTSEKMEALNTAQKALEEIARNDDTLLAQSRDRAKKLLEEYVKNVGDSMGESYTIIWKDVE